MWNPFRRRGARARFHVVTPPAERIDPDRLEELVPQDASLEERIAMATRCRDADPVPKVRDAGRLAVAGDGTRVQVMHNGLRMQAGGYHGAWMQDLIQRCRGHHEPQEERAFHAVLAHVPPKATMIELGGFWSYYTLWFLKDRPKRRAVVLEPDPAHVEVGRANARLNGLEPAFVQGFAGAHSLAPSPFPTEDSGMQEIACFAVADLMEQHRFKALDLLHLDIQGAEYETLKGCQPLFASGRVTWVFASTHAGHISGDPLTHQRCLAVLRNAGATIVVEHDVHESFSGDGLIVAKFGPLPEKWTPLEFSYNRYSQSLFRNPLYDLARHRRRSGEAG